MSTEIRLLKPFSNRSFDLCILDIMMPEMDGMTLAKEIRLTNPEIPMIFLTAKNQQEDIMEGFRSGADDYITKPFSMEELIYRIEAILRRTSGCYQSKKEDFYSIGSYTFDPLKQILSYKDQPLSLLQRNLSCLSFSAVTKT